MRTSPNFLARRLFAAAALTGLAGCGDVERTFGLVRSTPDEFTVETRAPLSMPPSYNLPAPSPGAARPQEVPSSVAAEAALSPATALSAGGPGGPASAGQSALVAQAGPAAPAGIRNTVNQEASLDRPSRSLTDRLMFWQSQGPAGTVLDPAAESRRLRENAALGQPATAGDTPALKDKKSSGFLGIF
jgi:hypothetical protein